jgi:hypothetical protein
MSRIGNFADDDVAGWVGCDDDEFWQRRRHHFTDELLADLALSCAMWLGMGQMLRTLDIGQQCRITLPSRA